MPLSSTATPIDLLSVWFSSSTITSSYTLRWGKLEKNPVKALFSLSTTLSDALSLGKFLSHLGIMSRVKSERAKYPLILLMRPMCAVVSLPRVEWIWYRVRFTQGQIQETSRSPEVFLLFVCLFKLASYLDCTKASSEFSSYMVACDIQLLWTRWNTAHIGGL